MSVLHLDFETYSSLNLKKVGLENYVRSPDFAVTTVAWAFDDEPVGGGVWPNVALGHRIRQHIKGGGVIKAWNKAFEWHVLTYAYNLDVSHEQMDCVMQRSLAFGLPAALLDAGEALKLPIVKDATAHRLMLQMGKPRKDGTAWHQDVNNPVARQKMFDLLLYCIRDVEAERVADKAIPPLVAFEKKLSTADAKINQKGVPINLNGVNDLKAAAAFERKRLDAECAALTGGVINSPGTERNRLMAWLLSRGLVIGGLTKEEVAAALARPNLDPGARRVLEIRQAVAKSSLAKLERMTAWASSHDGRARNLLQFYGAGRTGRWAGRGIQVQNLPRAPKDWKPQQVMDIAHCDPGALGLFHANPMKAISSSLRGCLTARPGHVLVSIDLSQIEARVLAWLAGQQDVVDAFAAGTDVYVLQAKKVGSSDRQLGKVLTLACGYGMGHVKFRDTAKDQYGLTMTSAQAFDAVEAWRMSNKRIKAFWYDMSEASKRALGVPAQRSSLHGEGTGPLGGIQTVGKVKLAKRGDTLAIRKPNGVKLYYHNPRVVDDEFFYDGVDQKTGKWTEIRTYGGRFVENVTQSVARDVMAEAILDAAPVLPVMTVHDEIVWEVPEDEAEVVAMALKGIVETVPAWASGLPLASDVNISWRYGK